MTTTVRADQYECTEQVLNVTPDAAIVANLGTASYALLDIDDRDLNFYMNGAMGVTTPTAFGLALTTERDVTVLEGDGSLLMSLGSLATVGSHDPENFTIVVWDNNTYQTTGGQETLSDNADLASIAENCGIDSWDVSSNEAFQAAYRDAVDNEGSSLIVCHVEPETPDHPRLDYAHSVVKYRFRNALIGADFRHP